MKTRSVLAAAVLALQVSAAVAHEPVVPAPAAPAEPATGPASVGVVKFANSGAPAAQADFTYGLAQLHNFQYPAAAAAFRRAQVVDPGFAMAYWGEAMTYNHPVWMQQDAAAARAVLARLGPDRAARVAKGQTERERAYLDAAEVLYAEQGDKFERDKRYALAMQRLHERWPEDIDATAFYALSLLGTAHAGRDVATYMKSFALLDDLFRQYPQHPGIAHYLIHSVDDAAHAPLGLQAARAYGEIAPESSHALHMSSHIYLALGLWDEVVAANERSLAVASRRSGMRGVMPIACGHGPIWLNYGYLQQGRYADAKRVLAECLALGRQHPGGGAAGEFNPEASPVGAFYIMRLRYLLDAPADAEVMGWTPAAGNLPYAEFLRDYGDAILAVRRQAAGEFAEAATRARASAARLRAEIDQAAMPADDAFRRVLAIQLGQLEAAAPLLAGQRAVGLAQLEAVAREEDALPAAFGPPQVDEPTRELLGRLLAASDPVQARQQFERALALNPGRVDARRGLLAATRALGDSAEADVIEAQLNDALRRADARSGAAR